jgi:hypothetical protein
MKDERSINAVKAAIAFGLGEITKEELATYAAADNTITDGIEEREVKMEENKLKTADICREIIGKEIINKINILL